MRYFYRRMIFSASWWAWNIIDMDRVTFWIESQSWGRRFWSWTADVMHRHYRNGDGYPWGTRLGTY